ncbi:MAG: exodeoxyribonuclease VII small subunit [Candidatus Methanomethylophilaceae archaeon]|nr:exodeoxyribonuclease VII small subunit [Candidatus Methanomethylophilaceae archaeon]
MNEEESARFAEEVGKMSFEESIQQLESLVEKLEAGGTDLDQSLEIYEKAVILRNHCKKVLDDGQRRIKKILETSSGVVETDFE